MADPPKDKIADVKTVEQLIAYLEKHGRSPADWSNQFPRPIYVREQTPQGEREVVPSIHVQQPDGTIVRQAVWMMPTGPNGAYEYTLITPKQLSNIYDEKFIRGVVDPLNRGINPITNEQVPLPGPLSDPAVERLRNNGVELGNAYNLSNSRAAPKVELTQADIAASQVLRVLPDVKPEPKAAPAAPQPAAPPAAPMQQPPVQQAPAQTPAPSGPPPMNNHFTAAAQPRDINLRGYGLLLPDPMPEDPQEIEKALATTAEHVSGRLARQMMMPDHQRAQIIDQFRKYDEGRPEGQRYVDLFERAKSAPPGTFDAAASVHELSQARAQDAIAATKHAETIKELKRMIEGQSARIALGSPDAAIKDTLIAASDPEQAKDILGDHLSRDQVFNAYGMAHAGKDVQTIAMNDGNHYALFEIKNEDGDPDYVLMSSDDLELAWHQKYLEELGKVTPYNYRQPSEGILNELQQIMDKSMGQQLPEAERAALEERQNEIYRQLQNGEHQAPVSLRSLSGMGSLGGQVHQAEQEIASGKPDVILAQRNLDELNPALQAAILRHQGQEEAAERVEAAMKAQPAQVPAQEPAVIAPPGS